MSVAEIDKENAVIKNIITGKKTIFFANLKILLKVLLYK